MRTFLNLLTLVFVIGVIYFVVKDTNLVAVGKTYLQAAEMQVGKISTLPNDLDLPTFDLDSTSSPASSEDEPAPQTVSSSAASASSNSTAIKAITPASTLQINSLSTVSSSSASSTLVVGPLSVTGIIADTNTQRITDGLGTLTESAKLDASAESKANDILQKQYFAHVSPNGTTLSDLLSAQGYSYLQAGENLALGPFTSNDDVVTAWMNSPEHKANILTANYTNIGIGIAYGMYQGSEVYVVVQHFGRPQSACPVVSDSMRAEVEADVNTLTTLQNSLAAIQTEIQAGEAEGEDVSSLIATYNSGVGTYNADYSSASTLRTSYNALVNAYNACLNSKQ